MRVWTKWDANPPDTCRDISLRNSTQPAGGADGKVRGSPKPAGFIHWGTMAVHHLSVWTVAGHKLVIKINWLEAFNGTKSIFFPTQSLSSIRFQFSTLEEKIQVGKWIHLWNPIFAKSDLHSEIFGVWFELLLVRLQSPASVCVKHGCTQQQMS